MALVDANVQWRLAPLVASVQVCATSVKQLDHLWLVTKRRVVHGPVSILVLDLHVDVILHEDLDEFDMAVLGCCLERSVTGKHAVNLATPTNKQNLFIDEKIISVENKLKSGAEIIIRSNVKECSECLYLNVPTIRASLRGSFGCIRSSK